MSIFQAFLITLIVWILSVIELWFGYAMVYVPLVLGPVVGLVLGDLQAGCIAGATLQLVFLGVMTIGAALPQDAALGTVIATAFAITSGKSIEAALPLAVPIAILGSFISVCIWTINSFFNPYIKRLCEKAEDKKITGTLYFLSTVPPLLRMIVLFLALAFGTQFAQPLVEAIPEVIMSGMEYGCDLMPAVGIGLLMTIMWKKETAVWFFLGVILVVYFNVPILAVACVGVIAAVIMVSLERDKTKGAALAAQPVSRSAEEELFND